MVSKHAVLKRARVIIAALAVTFAGTAAAQAQPARQMPMHPEQQQPTLEQQGRPWTDALDRIRGDDALVMAAATLAETKGSTRAVRSYAAELVRSRETFERDIRNAAKKDRVMLPAPRMPENAEQVRAELKRAQRGPAFDRAFLDAMIEANMHELLRVERAEAEISHAQVREHLEALRRELRRQFDEAKTLRSGMEPPGERPPRTQRQEQSAPMEEH